MRDAQRLNTTRRDVSFFQLEGTKVVRSVHAYFLSFMEAQAPYIKISCLSTGQSTLLQHLARGFAVDRLHATHLGVKADFLENPSCNAVTHLHIVTLFAICYADSSELGPSVRIGIETTT